MLLLLGTALTMRAADPVLGTWHLNVAKSRYDPGPAPKSITRTYQVDKGEIRAIVVTVYKNGNTDTVYYPASYDGKEHPVSGAPDRDGIVMKRINEYTAESLITHAGKTIGTSRRTVSADGQTMTITFKGSAVNGDQVNNTAFYEKEKE
jgi:hypothetical protein